MDPETLNQRLSQISTAWTLLGAAHGKEPGDPGGARAQLLQRYSGAAYRYLLGAVGDPDVAQDLAQEFALRFLRGDFRHAAPERGRFRHYLKTALIHLVTDHHRARRKWVGLAPDAPEPAAPAPASVDSDRIFLAGWREDLLERTWKALAEASPGYHAALRLRVAEPDLSSAQLAERLTKGLAKEVTAAWVRKALQRAHDKYAGLLLDEVAASLDDPTPGALRQELTELDLLRFCRTALERRGQK